MTGYLAIRQTVLAGLSGDKKRIVDVIFKDVFHIDGGASYEAPGAVLWWVYADWRWDERSLCYLGAVGANLGVIADSLPEVFEDREARAYIVGWCDGRGVVTLPGAIPALGIKDRGQELLDANLAPASVRFASAIPGSWTPVP